MPPSADFEIGNDLAELHKLMDGVTAWCRQQSFSEETRYEVSLIVDEVVSNIIRHGFRDGQRHTIRFGVSLEQEDLVMTVEDEGLHFNPLIIPPPDISKPMLERQAGGLGVYMVKKLTHEVQYRREGARNLLVLKKRAVFD